MNSNTCKNYEYNNGAIQEDGTCLTCAHASNTTVDQEGVTMKCCCPDGRHFKAVIAVGSQKKGN